MMETIFDIGRLYISFIAGFLCCAVLFKRRR